MTPEVVLMEGRPTEALKLISQQVKENPADPKRRVFLFQLLCLLGQWERAQTQLDVAGQLDPKNLLMVSAYTALLKAEKVRQEVLGGKRSPVIIGEPAQWLALLLQALKLDAQGQHAEAAPLRESAFDGAEAAVGTMNGNAFEWCADADARFGPCLEVIVEGGYSWVPFARIKELRCEPPADLRDLVWTPAQITWTNGGQAVAFIPTRYPGSERCDDSLLVMARKTEWAAAGDHLSVGRGQRMFATDTGEFPVLDVRSLSFAAS